VTLCSKYTRTLTFEKKFGQAQDAKELPDDAPRDDADADRAVRERVRERERV